MGSLERATVNIEGVDIVCEGVSSLKNCLQPGELYVAKRNGPWQLLTCAYVDVWNCWVYPVENKYVFSASECYRVLYLVD